MTRHVETKICRCDCACILALACMLCMLPVPVAHGEEGQGLSHVELKNAMRPYMQAIRQCAVRQKELDESVGGQMELSFTIGNRGRVTKVGLLTGQHSGSYVAGCTVGVIRSIEFPKFSGKPVVVPRFPVKLEAQEAPGFPEDDYMGAKEVKTRKAPPKRRARILRRLTKAAKTMRACVKDLEPPQKKSKRRRRRRRKPRRKAIRLRLSFNVSPLGHASDIEIAGKAHRTDHVAGCVAGVLSFVEFPTHESETFSISRLRLPPL